MINDNFSSQAIFTSSSQLVDGDPDINLLLDILTNISHLLIVTNSSVNIIVYVLKVKISESQTT